MPKQTSEWLRHKLTAVGLRPTDLHYLTMLTKQAISAILNGTLGRTPSGTLVAFLEAYSLLLPAQRHTLFARLDVDVKHEPEATEQFTIGHAVLFLEKYPGNLFVLYFAEQTGFSYQFDNDRRKLTITVLDDLVVTDNELPLSTTSVHIEKPAESNDLVMTFSDSGQVDIFFDTLTQKLIVHSLD